MYIYIITNQLYQGWVKIGKTINPIERLNSYQTCSPLRNYILSYYRQTSLASKIERYFKEHCDGQFEWYRISIKDASDIINNICDGLIIVPDNCYEVKAQCKIRRGIDRPRYFLRNVYDVIDLETNTITRFDKIYDIADFLCVEYRTLRNKFIRKKIVFFGNYKIITQQVNKKIG